MVADPWAGYHAGITGEWVLVTGSSGLIGAAVAERILGLGGNVLAVDRAPDSAAPDDEEREGELRSIDADVTAPEEIDEVLEQAGEVRARFMVHAAGWQIPEGRRRVASPAEWASVLSVHVASPGMLTIAFMAAAHRRGETASTVLLSSVHQDLVFGDPSYGAAKSAVAGLVRELAAAGAEQGSRVNGVAPGHVFGSPIESPPTRLGRRSIPPQTISKSVAFLLCDHCSPQTTGSVLFVDGGMRLNDPWASRAGGRQRRWRR